MNNGDRLFCPAETKQPAPISSLSQDAPPAPVYPIYRLYLECIISPADTLGWWYLFLPAVRLPNSILFTGQK